MKSNQFRIGNLVLCRGAISKIDAIFNDQISYKKLSDNKGESSMPLKFAKPILPTEEILLKLGFQQSGIDKRTFCPSFVKNGVKVLLSNSGHVYYGKLYIGSTHHLQNLYFTLTNEELILNSTYGKD